MRVRCDRRRNWHDRSSTRFRRSRSSCSASAAWCWSPSSACCWRGGSSRRGPDSEFEAVADSLRVVYELIFALILAFVIAAVLDMMGNAEAVVASEATTIGELVRANDALPEKRPGPAGRLRGRVRGGRRQPRVGDDEGRRVQPAGDRRAGGHARRVPHGRAGGGRADRDLQPGSRQPDGDRRHAARAAQHRGRRPADDAARARRHRRVPAARTRVPPGAVADRRARLHGNAGDGRHIGVPAHGRPQLPVRRRHFGQQRAAQRGQPRAVLERGARVPAATRR